MTKFEKITNNYGFKGKIKNNLKFDKKNTMNKNFKKRTKVRILVNEKTTLKY